MLALLAVVNENLSERKDELDSMNKQQSNGATYQDLSSNGEGMTEKEIRIHWIGEQQPEQLSEAQLLDFLDLLPKDLGSS